MMPKTCYSSSVSYSQSEMKTKICPDFKRRGFCAYGQYCRYAHGVSELGLPASIHPKYKTKPCRTYSEYGYCRYGAKCQFAHLPKPSPISSIDSQSSSQLSPKAYGQPTDNLQHFSNESMLYRNLDFMAYQPTQRNSEYQISGSSSSSSVDISLPSESSTSSSPEPMPTHESWPLSLETTVNNVWTSLPPARNGEFRRNSKAESSSSSWPAFGYDDQANSNATTVLPASSHAKRSLTSNDSSLGSSIDLISDSEIMSATPEPEPLPTHEFWPLKPEHVLEMSRLSINGESSTENIDEKYPSSLIALRPIYDEWQRIQKEPWGKPKKRTDGSFDPFFY